jgi:hypothetical protein
VLSSFARFELAVIDPNAPLHVGGELEEVVVQIMGEEETHGAFFADTENGTVDRG